MHVGSGRGVLSVQVAQGGEDVVSASKTEDGDEEARTKPRHLTEKPS